MCGIFGIVSKKTQKASLIVEGLKTLEYRGYDSWGIAAKKGEKLRLEKHIGKVGNGNLKKSLSDLNSQLIIGHTRWATHGNVTASNAHPHLDCTKTLAVVHNGIFENYEEIKKILLKKGHKFLSETDSEVIIHLIEEYLKRNSFEIAVQRTFNSLHGLNAIVVINIKSDEIIAVKNGSPLLVGVSTDELFITSDVSALFPHTKDIVVLEDDQLAVLGKKLKIVSLTNGEEIAPIHETIKTQNLKDVKGPYDHFLLKEIYDQPDVLKNLYLLERKNIEKLSSDIINAFGTFMLGCGTASYAALAGEYMFSKKVHKHINFSVGSEFKYLQDFITDKSLIIPISQSGETIDVVEPVKIAKLKGANIVSIVNIRTSTLSRLSDYAVFLNAGTEKAVVGTKSFTAMVGLLLLVAYQANGKVKEARQILDGVVNDTKSILAKKSIAEIKRLAHTLKKHDFAFTIGRGLSYVAALEAALKLKETALVHAEGFAGGELKHGVIALIEDGTPCFVFAPNDETYSEIISNAQEIKARGGFIIGIGPKKATVFDVFLKTADLAEGTLISQTVYMQLLAYFLAIERGIEDPDKPRNLAKSVTVK